MINKLFFLFLLLLSRPAFAINFPIEISEYIDDIKVDAYISQSDINEKLKWLPFETKLPLTVNEALEKVKHYPKSKVTLDNVSLIAIELKQIPHHKNYWHYLVETESITDGKRQNHFYVVLMDGKVVSAFKEPDSIK